MSRKLGRSDEDVKVSVNLSPVQVGMIDLLRGNGWHSTRSDIIRQALDMYFSRFAERIDLQVKRGEYFIGRVDVDPGVLDRLEAQDERLDVRCIGMVRFSNDIVDYERAERLIERIVVLGALKGPYPLLRRLDRKITTRVSS